MSCLESAKVQIFGLYSKHRNDDYRQKHYAGEDASYRKVDCHRTAVDKHGHTAAEQRSLIPAQRFGRCFIDEIAGQAVAGISDRDTDYGADKKIARIMDAEIKT